MANEKNFQLNPEQVKQLQYLFIELFNALKRVNMANSHKSQKSNSHNQLEYDTMMQVYAFSQTVGDSKNPLGKVMEQIVAQLKKVVSERVMTNQDKALPENQKSDDKGAIEQQAQQIMAQLRKILGSRENVAEKPQPQKTQQATIVVVKAPEPQKQVSQNQVPQQQNAKQPQQVPLFVILAAKKGRGSMAA